MKKNPIYSSAADAWMRRPSEPVHIGTTDTAKLIRAALRANWPGVKFSVRSSKYAGGSSIDVTWTDGPTARMVDLAISSFAGSGFDGMTDYQYARGAWLTPDGRATLRSVEAHHGTEGDTIEAARDGAIPVRFSADYVHTRRDHSIAHMRRTLSAYAHRYAGDELADAIKSGDVRIEPGRFADWEIVGAPQQYQGIGPGSQFGGDVVLRQFASRRVRRAA